MEPTTEAGNLGRRAVRGAAATGFSQLIRLALQVSSVVILARLLEPRDYGLVAMVLAVIGLAEFLRDFGLGAAAVRAETLSRHERDNLFWLNAALGTVFMVLTIVCAPLLSHLYGRAELTMITVALAPTFMLSGLAAQYRVDLLRGLRFGTLAWLEVVSAAVALSIGVALAVGGSGYWALVTQQVTSGVITLVLLVAACRWRPGAYDRSTEVFGFVRLGSAFVFGSVMAYTSRNVDNVIIGHQFGASALGAYTRSVQLVRTPLTQLQGPFATVAVPVLIAAGADDHRLLDAARKGQTALSYPIMAAASTIGAAAVPLVDVALGPQWSSASELVVWVAVGAAASCLSTPATWLFSVRGLGSAITGYNLAATVLTVLLLLLGSSFGVVGVAAAAATAALLGWPLALLFAHRMGGFPVAPLLVAGLRVGALAVVAGVAGRWAVSAAHGSEAWFQVISAAVAVALVFLACMPAPGYRRDFDHLRSMGAMLLPGRRS
jgi:O-antigen/teichoic acid export membrane protein